MQRYKNLRVIVTSRTVRLLRVRVEIGSSDYSIDKKEMYVTNFEIIEKYREKGYGHFLARVLIDLARLHKCKSIYLIDGATHDGFWQSLGFTDRKEDRSYVEIKL